MICGGHAMNNHYSLALFQVFLCLVIYIVPNLAASADVLSVSDDIATVAGWRSKAESYARKVKQRFPASSEKYKDAWKKYEEAKAAVDIWRYQLKAELIVGDPEDSTHYRQRVQFAADKAATFIGYAEDVLSRGGSTQPERVRKLLKGSIKADFAKLVSWIWEEVKKANKEKRDEINRIIDDLAWKSFEAV